MIKTYFKTAIRKIFKQPFYSTLNITAVTLSMSISLLILFIIFNQFDYDSANRRKDRIFRINTRVTTTNGDEAQFATIPYAAKDLLDSAVFESWVSLIALQSKSMGYGSKRFTVSGAIVTGNYFEMFNFPIISGSWGTSFSNASEVALSKHTSLKMFNTVDCIGRIIEIEGVGSFMVSAIYNDLDTKSHISNDFILSYSIIPSLFAKGSLDSNLSNINNYTSSYLYTLANRELSKNEINNVTKEMSSLAMSEFRPKNKEKEIAFFAQLLSNISPSRDLWLENSKALSFSTISIFSLIVFALVLLTALNYSSVMIALGLSRSKEIGIRKIVGAKRSHVFFQFIIEAIVIALISLFFALLLCPIIASFAPFQRLFVDTTFHVSIIPYAILFAVFIGLIAGAFPAAILSAYKEINMLHNLLNKVVLRGSLFGKQ